MRETVTIVFDGQTDNTGDNYAVVAYNFPILPVGTKINIVFDQEAEIEDGVIGRYTLGNDFGIVVELELDEMFISDRTWNRLKKVCVAEKNMGPMAEWYYPDVIDFGKLPTRIPKTPK